jgi:beta-glucosidase
LLRAQLSLGDGEYPPSVRGCEQHRALALEAATKSIVLLRNDGVLPLAPQSRVAVIGRLAVVPNLGDHGSSDTRPEAVVTPLAGLRAAGLDVDFSPGDDHDAAAALAASADVAVVVVGLDWRDEGENIDPADLVPFADLVPPPPLPGAPRWWGAGRRLLAQVLGRGTRAMVQDFVAGDRTMLRLHPQQEALVRAVARANPRTVVVLMGGGAVITEAWRHDVAALVLAWYPGQQGGDAVADVLLGRAAPSGRLPFAVPTEHGHLPPFDPRARSITYDQWHGYRRLQRDGHPAAFPFGYGLSYTTFETADLTVETREAHGLLVGATVTNTGDRPGAEVVQVYVEPPGQQVERPSRVLVGFARVELAPGASARVSIDVPWRRLAWFDEGADAFVLEPGPHRVLLAQHAEHDGGPATTVQLTAREVGR